MTRLPSLKSKDVLRALTRGGFCVDHQTGSHVVLRHPDGRRALLAMHARDLKRGTLLGVIKQAGYTAEEFIKLL